MVAAITASPEQRKPWAYHCDRCGRVSHHASEALAARAERRHQRTHERTDRVIWFAGSGGCLVRYDEALNRDDIAGILGYQPSQILGPHRYLADGTRIADHLAWQHTESFLAWRIP